MEQKLSPAHEAILMPLVQRQLELQGALRENKEAVAALAALIADAGGMDGVNPRFERRQGTWFLVLDGAKGDSTAST